MKRKYLILLMVIISIFVTTGCGKSDRIKEDKSNYTSSQVIEFLEEEGFTFKVSIDPTLIGKDSKTTYAHDENSTIWIQKIDDPYIGVLYNWHNSDLNDEYAEIKNTYKNEKYEEEQQYKEYQKWLKYYNLTNKQIIDALDYYDETN